jgi:hypothetical protein
LDAVVRAPGERRSRSRWNEWPAAVSESIVIGGAEANAGWHVEVDDAMADTEDDAVEACLAEVELAVDVEDEAHDVELAAVVEDEVGAEELDTDVKQRGGHR